MVRATLLALLLLFAVKSFAFLSLPGGSSAVPENYVHNASMYAVRNMKIAQWAYLGFAPRMEDPTRVKVVFSKATYTMRVSAQFTKQEIANYPLYLSKKAAQTAQIIDNENISFYQDWRWLHFYTEVLAIEEEFNITPDQVSDYSEQAYLKGLALLQEKFPTNIFPLPGASSVGPNDVAVVGHFVYPITVHVSGSSPRPRKDFTIVERYGIDYGGGKYSYEDNVRFRVEERRSFHRNKCKADLDGDGIKESTVQCNNDIFGGFPAIWIDAAGAGTGVHGPIRYTRESNNLINNRANWKARLPRLPKHIRQSLEARCAAYPKTMKEFWVRTDKDILGNYLAELEDKFQQPMTRLTGLENINLQWRLIRNNNSKGCFRAEPLEMRHILPSNRRSIHDTVKWTVTDDLDRVTVYDYNKKEFVQKYVDVNYYTYNHYDCDLTREEWVEYKILSNSKVAGPGKVETVQEFTNNSIQFDYNAPQAAEFYGDVSGRSDQSMKQLNQVGIGEADPIDDIETEEEEVLPGSTGGMFTQDGVEL